MTLRRWLLVLIVLLAVAGGLALFWLFDGATSVEGVQARVSSLGDWAPVGFVLLYAIATVAMIPGGLFDLVGGVLFGPVWGSLINLAGGTLGGGTFVNSLVCLRLPDDVREAWAEHGLEGVADAEFDAAQDAVWARLGVNTKATVPNRSNQLMVEALERTGHSWRLLPRNAPPHDPRLCGYCNGGCQQGEKQSTLLTYLKDAADAGARFMVDCRAERILVEHGPP